MGDSAEIEQDDKERVKEGKQVEELDASTVFVSEKSENVWPRVLNIMYNSEGRATLHMESKSGETATPLIYQLEDISKRELSETITLMERIGLVEQYTQEINGNEFEHVKLTKEGFEVAHERELAENQQEANENIAFFTLILAFAAILQTVTAALQLNQVGARIGILLILLVISLLIAIYNSQPRSWLERLRGIFG